MTREEAKDYIREWCPYDRQEEIIKALEQEPCEDCISRKALIEEIENGIKAGNYEEGYEEYPHINDMNDIIECIKYADSVQPKPKMGHWRHYEGMLICSECGDEFYDDIMEYCGDDVPNFCPNCGAKMLVASATLKVAM